MNLVVLFFPLLLKLVEEALDAGVDGAKVAANPVLKGVFQLIPGVIAVFGKAIVSDTTNTYDDAALEAINKFCLDTAQEGGFAVLELPI